MPKISQFATLFLIALLVSGCAKYNPNNNLVEPTPFGDFSAMQKDIIEVDTTIVSTPTPGDGFFLIHTEKSLYKFSSAGEIIWQIDCDGYEGIKEAVIVDNMVVVPIYEVGQFVVISLEDGHILWRGIDKQAAEHGNFIDDISSNKELLFVARSNENLTAYNIQNGALVWEMPLAVRQLTFTKADLENIYIANGNSFKVLDSKSGDLIWGQELGPNSGPFIKDDDEIFILAGGNARKLIALNQITKNITWEKDLDAIGFNDGRYGNMISDGNYLYLTGNKVIAVSKENGEIAWQSEALASLGKPALFDENIYVRDMPDEVYGGDGIYAVDIDKGTTMGRLIIKADSFDNNFERAPVVFGNSLLIPFGDNKLYIYKP